MSFIRSCLAVTIADRKDRVTGTGKHKKDLRTEPSQSNTTMCRRAPTSSLTTYKDGNTQNQEC
jgi:hypothetical protein